MAVLRAAARQHRSDDDRQAHGAERRRRSTAYSKPVALSLTEIKETAVSETAFSSPRRDALRHLRMRAL
jgi:hypothetical protein